MIGEVIGGASLALRRWRELVGTTLIFSLVCLAMSLVLGDVITQVEVLRGGEAIRRERAVAFAPFYPIESVSMTSPRLLGMLSEKIEKGKAYSSVLYNLGLDSPEDFVAPTILVAGGRVGGLFPDLGLAPTAPGAFVGADVTPTSSVRLGSKQIPIVGKLRRGAVWFDPSAAGIELDDHQVLQVTPEEFSELDVYAKEELVLRAVFLDASDDFIAEYIAEAAKGGLYLVPQRIAIEQPQRFASLMVRASLYVISMAAFLLLELLSFGATTREILERERRGFTIRRMCGATRLALTVRLASFLAMIVLALPVPMCLVLMLVGGPASAGALAALVSLPPTYAVLLLTFLRRVSPGKE